MWQISVFDTAIRHSLARCFKFFWSEHLEREKLRCYMYWNYFSMWHVTEHHVLVRVKPNLHEQIFLDNFSLSRKTWSCRWQKIVNFSLSRKTCSCRCGLTRTKLINNHLVSSFLFQFLFRSSYSFVQQINQTDCFSWSSLELFPVQNPSFFSREKKKQEQRMREVCIILFVVICHTRKLIRYRNYCVVQADVETERQALTQTDGQRQTVKHWHRQTDTDREMSTDNDCHWERQIFT